MVLSLSTSWSSTSTIVTGFDCGFFASASGTIVCGRRRISCRKARIDLCATSLVTPSETAARTPLV